MVAFSAAEFAALALSAPFWVYETLLFAILFSLGLTFTSTTTLAMNLARDNAGTASAVFGAAGFAFGGLVSPLVGLGDMLTTTGIVFFAGSLLSFFFAAFATKSDSARFGGVCGLRKVKVSRYCAGCGCVRLIGGIMA